MAMTELQHLLPEQAREPLAVIPKRSLSLSVFSLMIIGFGGGLAVGTGLSDVPFLWLGFPVALLAAYLMRGVANRHDDEMLERFKEP